MGAARRRKLAGDPPRGPKREKTVRKRRVQSNLMDGAAFATMMALMMGMKRRK